MRGKVLKAASQLYQLHSPERLFGTLTRTTPHSHKRSRLEPAVRPDSLHPRPHSLGIILATLSNTCSHADPMQVPSTSHSHSVQPRRLTRCTCLSRSHNDLHWRPSLHHLTAHASVPHMEGRWWRFKLLDAAHFLIRCAVIVLVGSSV